MGSLTKAALVLLAAVSGALASPDVAGAGPAADASRTVILDTGSSWRRHYTWGPLEGLDASPTPPSEHTLRWGGDTIPPPPHGSQSIPTPPAPGGWAAPDFDDRGWARGPGPIFKRIARSPRTLRVLYLRGKFRVADPAKAPDLRLDAAWCGGLVVYLNGTEVARADMPAGALAPDTLALSFPLEAYTVRGIPRGRDPRERRLDGLVLPRRLLRAGVNFLALEIRRAADRGDLPEKTTERWNTVKFCEARLTAPAGEPVKPNTAPPPGLQVWNASPFDAVGLDLTWGDPCEMVAPLELVAPRGGCASGQVVVSRIDGALPAVRAALDPLTKEGGGAALRPDTARVAYAQPQPIKVLRDKRVSDAWKYDALLPAPTEGTGVQPVWVTVDVPPDAVPGAYRATLTVRAGDAAPVQVPVRLTVCPWRVPTPADRATYVGLVQSPTSVARQYGTPMWSDAHFERIATSLEASGRLGNRLLVIPIVLGTEFREAEALVRWVRRGDRLDPDFGVLDRYLDVFARHVVRPDTVIVYAWTTGLGALSTGRGNWTNVRTWGKPAPVVAATFVDPQTGATSTDKVAAPGSGREAETLWQPVWDGLRERVLARGWDERAIMVGLAKDYRPRKEHVQFFRKVAPYARWALLTHQDTPKLELFGVPAGHLATAFAEYIRAPEAGAPPPRGWKVPWQRVVYPRNLFSQEEFTRPWLKPNGPLATYRNCPEACLMSGYRGLSMIGLDFWPVEEAVDGTRRTILEGSGATLGLQHLEPALLAPGPEGAVPTIRSEMLREGLALAEARIAIEKALVDEAARRRLGEDLATRARRLLDERVGLYLTACEAEWTGYGQWSGWQAQSAALFALADEVTRALGAADGKETK